MKRLATIIALVLSVTALAKADNLPTNGTEGQVLYWDATTTTGSNATWGDLQSLVTVNNITVPATIGAGVNGATPDTVGNLNFVGTGLQSTVSGSGPTSTSNVDFSNLSTTEGQTNSTNISNLSNTVNNNSTDISSLNSTVSNHTTQINTLNDGLAQEVVDRTNGDAANATSITNETTRATGAENTLTNNLSNEASERAAGDAALQNQVNHINATQQNHEDRINRLEETKFLLEPTVRLFDTKRFQGQVYDSYDVRHGSNFALGARIVLKLGKSYEERVLAGQAAQIAALTAALAKLQAPAPAASGPDHSLWFISSNGEVHKKVVKDESLINEIKAGTK